LKTGTGVFTADATPEGLGRLAAGADEAFAPTGAGLFGAGAGAGFWHVKNEEAEGAENLGGGEADAAGILQRVHHVRQEMADFGGGGVLDRAGLGEQDRVTHAGDFKDCHGCIDGPAEKIWRERKL